MNLRPPPRIPALAAVFALAVLFGLGLAAVAARELRPGRAAGPETSHLLAVLDGRMAVNTSPPEAAVFRTWVQGGATREGWPPVAEVLANNCGSCHGDGGEYPRLTRYEDLLPWAVEAAPAGLLALVRPRTLHLIVFPVLLAIGLLFLRRLTEGGWKIPMAAAGFAIAFDLGQWLARGGGPGLPWAAWTGAGLLAAAMASQVSTALFVLWRPRRG